MPKPLSIQYNRRNMPTRVGTTATSTDGLTLVYDADMTRVRKVAPVPNTETFYLDDQYSRSRTIGGSTYTERLVVTAGDRSVAEVTRTGSTETPVYLHEDLLGSAELVTSSSGGVTQSRVYDAFGNRRSTSATFTTREDFTGQELDSEFQLLNMRARLYDPQIGRFLAADPLATLGRSSRQLNPYSYVGNRPTRLVDPSGMYGERDGNDANIGEDLVALFASALGAIFGGGGHHHNPPVERPLVDPHQIIVPQASPPPAPAPTPTAAPEVATFAPHESPARTAIQAYDFVAETVNDFFQPKIRITGAPVIPLHIPTSDEVFSTGNLAMTAAGIAVAAVFKVGGPAITRLSNGLRAGKYGALTRLGIKDAHHIIQDAAVRELPGYSRTAAPAVELPGPATRIGAPHYNATQVQRQAGGGTYAAERRIGYKALRKGGLSPDDARAQVQVADDYFRSIEVEPATPTRIPTNR
jgi:RHS repeat-associated protein